MSNNPIGVFSEKHKSIMTKVFLSMIVVTLVFFELFIQPGSVVAGFQSVFDTITRVIAG